jgi:hypothetical protein
MRASALLSLMEFAALNGLNYHHFFFLCGRDTIVWNEGRDHYQCTYRESKTKKKRR